jgi:hypothetical protein
LVDLFAFKMILLMIFRSPLVKKQPACSGTFPNKRNHLPAYIYLSQQQGRDFKPLMEIRLVKPLPITFIHANVSANST